MTVGTQVKTTLASLKSAQASFETFALATDNKMQKSSIKTQLNKLNPSR